VLRISNGSVEFTLLGAVPPKAAELAAMKLVP
jgi:hypothetical protein